MIQGVMAQTDPSYPYHRWHGSLLIFAVMLVVFLVNSIGTRLLSFVEGFVLILHLSGFLAVLVPLLYYSDKGTSKEVWGTFTNLAGWESNGLAWWVGLISANLPLIGKISWIQYQLRRSLIIHNNF
jgi:amino acid transporter